MPAHRAPPGAWRRREGGRPLPGRPRPLLRSGGGQRAFASRQRGPPGSRGHTRRFNGLRNRRACRGSLCSEYSGEREPLALGERPDLLVLGNSERDQQPPATSPTPALLAHQQVADRHAVSLPRTAEDHLSGGELARCDSTLHPSPGEAYAIGVLQRLQMLLLTSVDRGRLAHQTSPHYVRSRTTSADTPVPSEPPGGETRERVGQTRGFRLLQRPRPIKTALALTVNHRLGRSVAKSGLFVGKV